jgi:hypothetical protein
MSETESTNKAYGNHIHHIYEGSWIYGSYRNDPPTMGLVSSRLIYLQIPVDYDRCLAMAEGWATQFPDDIVFLVGVPFSGIPNPMMANVTENLLDSSSESSREAVGTED